MSRKIVYKFPSLSYVFGFKNFNMMKVDDDFLKKYPNLRRRL